ncbi:MAG: Gp49 family protein [Devosia sp.]
MDNKQLEEAIEATPYEKVTKESIQAKIAGTDYMIIPNSTVTICSIRMKNGFSVRGESACVDSRNFDVEIGRQIAQRDAFSKLWQLEGYLLAEKKSV